MTNKYPVIPVEDYYVVVEKTEIQFPANIYCLGEGLRLNCQLMPCPECRLLVGTIGKRIEGVPLIELPDTLPSDKEIIALIEKHWKPVSLVEISAFKLGYKAAGGYSEEDMRKAFKEGSNVGSVYQQCMTEGGDSDRQDMESYPDRAFDEFMQSLKPKPVEVELETYNIGGGYGLAHKQPLSTHVKITNSETNTIIPVNVLYENSTH